MPSSEDQQSKGVEGEVQDPDVEEHGGEETPVLPARDQRPEHGAELEQHLGTLRAPSGAALELHRQPHDQVDRQQSVGYDGPSTGPGQRAPCPPSGSAAKVVHRQPPASRGFSPTQNITQARAATATTRWSDDGATRSGVAASHS